MTTDEITREKAQYQAKILADLVGIKDFDVENRIANLLVKYLLFLLFLTKRGTSGEKYISVSL